ncbi:DUF2490 domain-containing protein [Flagellimonas flava]|uniref:DUF2490 domain-containing protein n=1 Tax=Flagellimonas flava TaxID=570519 RepID=A0A1M5LSR8_9FLAO|nr:DUF2490 domain-containing protein [Allomuricauda flava]SHG68098.1 Protein of unknown function [Allomuricauda flava]
MVYVKRLTLPLFLFFIHISIGQTFDENRSGSWLEFSGVGKIGDDWSIPLAGILKHRDVFDTYDFSFIRTGISYRTSPSTVFTPGIAFLNTNSFTDRDAISVTSQFWVYEEFSVFSNRKRHAFSHRWRLEHRWIRNDNNTEFNHRVRYRLQYKTPLHGNLYFKVCNEIFLNTRGHAFNQNRFFIGVGRTLSESIKIDLGFLKNHFRTSGYGAVRMGLYFDLDFTTTEVAQIDN